MLSVEQQALLKQVGIGLIRSVFRGGHCAITPSEDLLGRKPARKQRQIHVQFSFLFFQRSLDFIDENHEIRN